MASTTRPSSRAGCFGFFVFFLFFVALLRTLSIPSVTHERLVNSAIPCEDFEPVRLHPETFHHEWMIATSCSIRWSMYFLGRGFYKIEDEDGDSLYMLSKQLHSEGDSLPQTVLRTEVLLIIGDFKLFFVKEPEVEKDAVRLDEPDTWDRQLMTIKHADA